MAQLRLALLCAWLALGCVSAIADSAGEAATVVAASVEALPGRLRPLPGGRAHKVVDRLMRELTLDEKVSLMSSDSPAINRSGVLLVPAFNWWSECLHGAVDQDEGLGGTVFPQPIGLAASFDRSLLRRVGGAIGREMRAKANEAERQGQGPRFTNCFAPNINLFRDPRWGRGSETYGEDPFLTGELAVEYVSALQGDHPTYLQAGATCKHFAAYSLEEWQGESRHDFDARLDPRDARDSYLPAFRACVMRARAQSVMCSYNAVNGVPACANSWLLGDTLRGDMRFGGMVVSDCGAVEDLTDGHRVTASHAEGAAATLKAGTDVACSDYSYLRESLERGLVSEDDIDTSVRRLLLTRFALGHFDGPQDHNPFRYIPTSVVGSREHQALAREAARKSIVLLKNIPLAQAAPAQWCSGSADGGCAEQGAELTLPLRLADLKRITVLGPFANRSEYLLGSYYGRPSRDLVSPYQAIVDRVGGRASVDVFYGTEVLGQGADTVGAAWACERSDVCIFFVGTSSVMTTPQDVQRYGNFPVFSPLVESEGWDRQHITLPGQQLNLIQGVARRTSTPIVVVLVHGGPLDVEWLQASPQVGAILTAWQPGQGAAALADVLFGDTDPGGRLPVTFPFRNYTAQSDFTDMSMRRWPGRTHRYLQVPVLYPFGHGLSYTTFEHSDLTAVPAGGSGAGDAQPSKASSAWCGESAALHVSLTVTNAGDMAADDVVLLMLSYKCGSSSSSSQQLRHWLPWASARRQGGQPGDSVVTLDMPCTPPGGRLEGLPLQSLVGFDRVHVAPGRSGAASFTLAAVTWLPFSPLDSPADGRPRQEQGADGRPRHCPRPYCGDYILRAGSQQAVVRLGDARRRGARA